MKNLISYLLVGVLAVGLTGCGKSGDKTTAEGGKKLTIALLPKSKGNAYFISVKDGAEKAAEDLGVEWIFDGPTDTDPARQTEIVEKWITLGVVAIAHALMDEAARLTGGKGEFAIISASLTASNQIEWQKHIEAWQAEKYPEMKLVAVRPCDDLKDKAQAEATALLGANPNLKLLMAICSPAVPGAAEAVKQAGKAGQVHVMGLGLPNENRRYVKEGVTASVILWKTEDLGYLTVHAAAALANGTLKPGDKKFTAGSLGTFEIRGDNILLGTPFIFNKENIDQFDF